MAKTESTPIPTTNALVVVADPPLDNRMPLGKNALGVVQIVVETGAAPIMTSRRFKLNAEHWLVPGMTIPVMLDPANPADFDIDWASIPSIQDRAAASDPTLTDPIGTRKKMADAIQRASSSPSVANLPDALRQSLQQFAGPAPSGVDHFAESLAKAKSTVAPDGKQSAVVLIATTAGTFVTDSATGEQGVSTHHGLLGNKHDAVLSVNVPGRPAYAVFVHDLKQPIDGGDAVDGGFPALVSLSDPNDVEVLWQDAPSMTSQITETMNSATDEMAAKEQMLLTARTQMATGMQPGAAPPFEFRPPPPIPTGPAVNPMMQAMMAQNAQMMLNMATDPAQRALLVQQYRLAGIPLPNEPA
jgi:hypothetical protein